MASRAARIAPQTRWTTTMAVIGAGPIGPPEDAVWSGEETRPARTS
ncbi:hypothetical protein J4E08_21325 [Sagittula sp. NFXS13]